jgi:glycosyltransferase involved in cell wall biosynthesis
MRQSAAADDRTPLDRIDVATTGVTESRAVAPAEIADARRSLGIADGARVIGVVSRLRREKGIDVLIRALDHLDGIDNAHVIIAGTGPEESHLRQLAAHAPIPIHFLGHRDDVALWYAASDVIAIPSTRESFGRTTVEAMAAGRPLIAARVGGLAEAVVDGETGLLVPPENSEALAAALRRLLGDNDALRRCGEAARARFEACFTIEHMATARRQAWERALRR